MQSDTLFIPGRKIDTIQTVCPMNHTSMRLSARLADMILDAEGPIREAQPHRSKKDIIHSLTNLVFLDFTNCKSTGETILRGLKNFKRSHISDYMNKRFSNEDDPEMIVTSLAGFADKQKPSLAFSLSRILPKGTLREMVVTYARAAIPRHKLVEDIQSNIQRMLMTENVDYLKFLDHIGESARIVVTERGRIGLAPSRTEEGDAVAIIQGARAPFILRQVGRRCFQNVGKAYIRKIMFGEALEKENFYFKEIQIV